MNYDTLTPQFAGCSDHIDPPSRRILDIAALRRVYGRFVDWENQRHVLLSQVAPAILWISFCLALNWVVEWSVVDATTAAAPAQTQSETQAQPVSFGCR